MRAGQNLAMMFPGDTEPTMVPRELAAKARVAGAKYHGKNYSPPQERSLLESAPMQASGQGPVIQRLIDAAPDIMGGAGGFMGVTPAQRTGNAVRLGVAGRAGQHVVNTLTGAEQGWTPQEAGVELTKEAARQGAMTSSGELLAKGGSMLAEPLMKSSLGRSAVGSAKKALKAGLRPTEEFLDKTMKRIGVAKKAALALAKKLEGEGRVGYFDELVGPLRKEAARYGKNDVTGKETQNAMHAVIREMEDKIGPQVTDVPSGVSANMTASEAANPNANLRGVFQATYNKAAQTEAPAKLLTPTQIQDINQIVGQKLKDLFAAKQGKIGVPPDPRERAYMAVWAKSKKMLEQMGNDGAQISKLNKEMQNLYGLHALASNAGKRAHPFTAGGMLPEAIAAGGAAMAGHNPLLALGALPAAALRHVATTPDALAREAAFFGSQGFGAGARIAPRVPLAAYNQLQTRQPPEAQ